jgi:excisionase family DNA binding protein
MTEQLMTAKEVADRLQVSVRQVLQLAKDDLIPNVRIQTSVRFRPSEITAWIAGLGQQHVAIPKHLLHSRWAKSARNSWRDIVAQSKEEELPPV